MMNIEKKRIPPPVLTSPYAEGIQPLETDAYNVQNESMLKQEQPEKTKKTIGHCSSFLTKADEA